MPTDLIHRIGIAAPAEKIYRALTTEEGIQAWWTTDVKMDAHAGGKAVFGFFDHSTEFQMRLEQLTPPAIESVGYAEADLMNGHPRKTNSNQLFSNRHTHRMSSR